jgi:hypothetical protein
MSLMQSDDQHVIRQATTNERDTYQANSLLARVLGLLEQAERFATELQGDEFVGSKSSVKSKVDKVVSAIGIAKDAATVNLV